METFQPKTKADRHYFQTWSSYGKVPRITTKTCPTWHCLVTQHMAPWCNDYHYCTTFFNNVWTQVLRRFKSCSQNVRDLWWWGSLTMVPAGNKAERLSSVNHTIKAIHQCIIRKSAATTLRNQVTVTMLCLTVILVEIESKTSGVTSFLI